MHAGNAPTYASNTDSRILLVSADDALRADVSRWLGDRYEVETFSGAAAALLAIGAQPPALVLGDAETPQLDVAALLRVLRADAQQRAIPLILLATEEPQAGADEYLLKPFGARELRACVDSQIKLSRLRRQMAQALRQSEERYRAIVEGQSEMVCRFRPDGTILFINGAYARARGATPEQLVGANFWDFIEEEDRPGVRAMLQRIRPEAPELRIENRFETAEGVRWTLWTNRGLLFDEEGRATELQSAGIDITDRKRAEEALRQSEKRFRLMADAAPVKIWIRDADGKATWFNEKWLQFVGRSLQDELGEGWIQNVYPGDSDSMLEVYKRRFDARQSFSLEYRVRRYDGQYRWVLDNGIPLYTAGEFNGYIGSCIDIHDRKEAERALRQLNETLEERVEQRTRQVRRLLARLTMAEQEERRYVSQILHDDLQQLLYGIEMKMALIQEELQTVGRPVLLDELQEARAWIYQAITTTRHLTVDLSPPILQNEGLADALSWLQSQMQELHGMQVSLEADHSFYLPDEDLRVLLFHMVRELLFNVKKHAGVDRATVYLRETDGQLIIDVVDQGQGFNPLELTDRAQHSGFGLFSIRERLKLLGGQLKVQSQSGQGTRIRARLPLPPEVSGP